MHVDEARSDRESRTIESSCGIGGRTIADMRDPPVLERDVRAVRGRPGTIDDETTVENDVEHSVLANSATGLACALSGTTCIDITRGLFLARSISLPLLP